MGKQGEKMELKKILDIIVQRYKNILDKKSCGNIFTWFHWRWDAIYK